MKFLLLPSHRMLLYYSLNISTNTNANNKIGKKLMLLPDSMQAQQYVVLGSQLMGLKAEKQEKWHGSLLATLYYKTINIYSINQLASQLMSHSKDNNKQQIGIKPLISQTLQKKIQVLDIYSTNKAQANKQTKQETHRPHIECIISDKFGDMYKIPIATGNKEGTTPQYQNSNLGIPHFIKHIDVSGSDAKLDKYREFFMLADEQNKIKLYNADNTHELVSVWFMVDCNAIQCSIMRFYKQPQLQSHSNNASKPHDKQWQWRQCSPVALLLLHKHNKQTLQTRLQLHYISITEKQLTMAEYPGHPVPLAYPKNYSSPSANMSGCLYYTMVQVSVPGLFSKSSQSSIYQSHPRCPNAVILLYLFEDCIKYELVLQPQILSCDYKPVKEKEKELKVESGQIVIEKGKWDFLSAIDSYIDQRQEDKKIQWQQQNANIVTVYVAYGCDVQNPIEINASDGALDLTDKDTVQLNKYEKMVKLQIKL